MCIVTHTSIIDKRTRQRVCRPGCGGPAQALKLDASNSHNSYSYIDVYLQEASSKIPQAPANFILIPLTLELVTERSCAQPHRNTAFLPQQNSNHLQKLFTPPSTDSGLQATVQVEI